MNRTYEIENGIPPIILPQANGRFLKNIGQNPVISAYLLNPNNVPVSLNVVFPEVK